MDVLLTVFGTLLFITALFLILLVLVQRGRGGGLTGALGGMGGQSAFGSKAGDVFTRITVAVSTFWILLCIVTILLFNRQTSLEAAPGASEEESAEYELVEPEGEKSKSQSGSGIGEAQPAPGEKDAGESESE
ncbi:MAG: preprotein translocase subunit SecG [Planctomycetota bacterium]